VLFAAEQNVAEHTLGIIAAGMIVGAIRVVTTSNLVHAALWLVTVLGGGAPTCCCWPSSSPSPRSWSTSRHHGAPLRHDVDPACIGREAALTTLSQRGRRALLLVGARLRPHRRLQRRPARADPVITSTQQVSD
jgi:hypothetical protein